MQIIPDDDPVSIPSERTMPGGDPAMLGRIDHYDLLCKLGGGGFGVVYLARDTASGVQVAIKTLHPLLKHNAEEMDLLREKFRLVSRLTHTNIAKALVLHPVRDLFVRDETARRELKLSSGDSVMVMDYAPGVTLSKWRRQFPDGVVLFDHVLEIGRRLAAALDYAHGEKIVHRDIKPGNVMVETRENGRLVVRLLDFGLAAEIRSSMSRVSTEAGDTSGTRPYMAPEQWLGRKQDGRTDQYALACILYELLSGSPPFAGVFETGDPSIMKAAVVSDPPEEIDGLSPAVNAALQRALAKTPKDRFPSCAAFVAAFAGENAVDELRDPESGKKAAASTGAQSAATLEADVLRRKVAFARDIAAIPAEDASHVLLAPLVREASTELAATEEACKFARFAAAAACLDRADTALEKWRAARRRLKEGAERAEAERRRQEEEKRARLERDAETRRRRDAERRAREIAAIRQTAAKAGYQAKITRQRLADDSSRAKRSGCLAILLLFGLVVALAALSRIRI